MTMEEWEENRCPYCTADYCISKNCNVSKIPISDGATNGEVLEKVFPDVASMLIEYFDTRWINALYKKGNYV